MKIENGYLLREVAGTWVVVPLGNRVVQLNGIISLNDSAALLWRLLEKGASKGELVQLLTNEYDISQTDAMADVESFLAMLKEKGLLL